MAPGTKKGHIPPSRKNMCLEILLYPSSILRSNPDIRLPSEQESETTEN